MEEDRVKKKKKKNEGWICFEVVFFKDAIKAIFSWGLHFLISVLHCFSVFFFCASFLDVYLITLNSILCHMQYLDFLNSDQSQMIITLV